MPNILPQASKEQIVIAVPKGRILDELLPVLGHAGIAPEPCFFDPKERRLAFETSDSQIRLIRVRSSDVPTFVANGGAHFGMAGLDALLELPPKEMNAISAHLDLRIGHCRLSVAAPPEVAATTHEVLHRKYIRIATKYPKSAQRHFAIRGIHADCIKLNGAVELAPSLGLSNRIVDLVSSGATLKSNGLIETALISKISTRLILNRAYAESRMSGCLHSCGAYWMERFEAARPPIQPAPSTQKEIE